MLKRMREKLICVAIAVLVAIFLLVLIESTRAATIFSDGAATISIDGQLWPGDVGRLTRELGKVRLRRGANMLNIVIDSGGGSADVSQSMMYVLSQWSKKYDIPIRTKVYTKALSGAGLLFLIGHERIIGDLAVVMIHEVWFEGAAGMRFTLEDMIKSGEMSPAGAKATRGFNSLMYQLLAERTTIPAEWVKDSRVITAEEAYKHNLATHYITF